MAHDEKENARCECTSDHRPAVLEHVEHHIVPLFMGGPSTDDNKVWLCPTAHYNVHELLRMMVTEGRIMKNYEFSNREIPAVSRYAARIAREGYKQWIRDNV